jgi:membrane protein DedA with SNARE-associated domain
VLLTLGIWIFPFAEEIALITVGYLIFRGVVPWWLMIPIASIGVFLGDAVLFWLGRRCDFSVFPRLASTRRYERSIERISAMLDQYGVGVLFCARFLPGMRFPTHVVVGTSGMSVSTYITIGVLSIVFYVPLVVLFAYTLGEEIEDIIHHLHHLGYATWALVFMAVSLWLVLQQWG